jgi:cytidylate kinase
VLPDADVKLFLVANSENRAKRRYKELLEKGQNVSYEEVLSDMIQRDKNDSERQTAPCVAAPDAILFDNSALTLEETIVKALEIIHGKINETV